MADSSVNPAAEAAASSLYLTNALEGHLDAFDSELAGLSELQETISHYPCQDGIEISKIFKTLSEESNESETAQNAQDLINDLGSKYHF